MEATSLEDIFTELVRFQIEAWNAVDAALKREHDLQLSYFEILRVIAATENCRVNDIAEIMVITVGGASKIVDRLESAGLVERSANPDDRRSSIVEVAASGTAVLDNARPTYDAELQLLFAGVDLTAFAATLTALRNR